MTSKVKAIECTTHLVSKLPQASILSLSGSGCLDFLQNLVTQDMRRVVSNGTGYTGWLNRNGRLITDSLLHVKPEDTERVLISAHNSTIPLLQKHMRKYILRQPIKVELIKNAINYSIILKRIDNINHRQLLDDTCKEISALNPDNIACFVDPRVRCGIRLIMKDNDQQNNNIILPSNTNAIEYTYDDTAFDTVRLLHGIPMSPMDLRGEEKTIPLEYNLDYLHGVSFDKGCYLGQELTARTFHQGLIRKRLLPCYLTNDDNNMNNNRLFLPLESYRIHDSQLTLPYTFLQQEKYDNNNSNIIVYNNIISGDSILNENGRKLGTFYSLSNDINVGIALLRLEQVMNTNQDNNQNNILTTKNGIRVVPYQPDWWPKI